MDLANINLNLYKCFIAVYEARGYTKAIEVLKMARNNIKLNIEALEEHLKTKLFMGHPRGVEPTSEAEKLYPRIKALFNEFAKIEGDLKEFTSESEAVVRVIVQMTSVATIWKDFFKNFKKKYPNIQFELLNRSNSEIYNEFLLGQVDLVIDLEDILVFKKHWMNIIKLMTGSHVFIATKKFLTENNLSEKININELSKYQLIAHQYMIDKIEEKTGITLKPFIKTSTLEAVYPLVESGAGIGIYPKELLDKRENKVIQMNCDIELPNFKFVCGYNKETITKAAQTFIDEFLIFCSKS